MRVALRWRWVGALALSACSHMPRVAPVAPGATHLPYRGLPRYLIEGPPLPTGPVARYDERLPVVGGGATGLNADRLDLLRLRLAALDEATLAFRAADAEREPVEAASDAAHAIVRLVRGRLDLSEEASELVDLTTRLPAARGLARDRIIARILEIDDLIRIQIRS